MGVPEPDPYIALSEGWSSQLIMLAFLFGAHAQFYQADGALECL